MPHNMVLLLHPPTSSNETNPETNLESVVEGMVVMVGVEVTVAVVAADAVEDVVAIGGALVTVTLLQTVFSMRKKRLSLTSHFLPTVAPLARLTALIRRARLLIGIQLVAAVKLKSLSLTLLVPLDVVIFLVPPLVSPCPQTLL